MDDLNNVSEQNPVRNEAPEEPVGIVPAAEEQAAGKGKKTKKKSPGLPFGILSLVLGLMALMESSYPVAYKVIMGLYTEALEGKYSGPNTIVKVDTSLSDVVAGVFTGAMYVFAGLAVVFGIVGIIMFAVSKVQGKGKAGLILSIVGATVAVAAIFALMGFSSLALSMPSII